MINENNCRIFDQSIFEPSALVCTTLSAAEALLRVQEKMGGRWKVVDKVEKCPVSTEFNHYTMEKEVDHDDSR